MEIAKTLQCHRRCTTHIQTTFFGLVDVEGCPFRKVLQQDSRRSSAQNRDHGGDVRLKSGEPAAVPTAAVAVGVHKTTKKSAAKPRCMSFETQNFLLKKDT